MPIIQLWNIMPISEKIGAVLFAITFPVLVLGCAVVLP
jgi:hypothetical protein